MRDLTMDERAYVNTRFAGDDGGRPYVKASYWSFGPDGKRSGFIYRSPAIELSLPGTNARFTVKSSLIKLLESKG